MTVEFGPAHKCRRCGVEVQLVTRSFGRQGYEATETGLHHRYNCAGKQREIEAMIAKVMEPEYMPEAPGKTKPKVYRPIDLGVDE